jgi:Mrp family chromosome partitioning ATPase
VEVSALADAVVLVIQAEATRQAVADAVIAQVRQMGGHVAGIVMTGRRYHIPRWAYRLALNEGSLPA